MVGTCIRELSRQFDLSRLDGVTVAYDYAQALLDLDRGYETNFRLTPSDTHVVGIAMTPSVIRDGTLKSHVLLNAAYMAPLEDFKHEHFGFVLHTISHECAHVEVTHKFDAAFPGFLLRTAHADARIGYRWQIILACWDEYAATLLSAGFGAEPTEGYEDTFLKSSTTAWKRLPAPFWNFSELTCSPALDSIHSAISNMPISASISATPRWSRWPRQRSAADEGDMHQFMLQFLRMLNAPEAAKLIDQLTLLLPALRAVTAVNALALTLPFGLKRRRLAGPVKASAVPGAFIWRIGFGLLLLPVSQLPLSSAS